MDTRCRHRSCADERVPNEDGPRVPLRTSIIEAETLAANYQFSGKSVNSLNLSLKLCCSEDLWAKNKDQAQPYISIAMDSKMKGPSIALLPFQQLLGHDLKELVEIWVSYNMVQMKSLMNTDTRHPRTRISV